MDARTHDDDSDAPPPAMAPADPYGLAGQLVSHYEVGAAIGRGGMGVVYRAEDVRLQRPVALKFLPPPLSGDAHAIRRLQAEARAASALDHPNIGTVHEFGETEGGQLFIAMAYYPGETLRHRIDRGPLPTDEALDIAAQLAAALARAHAAGIVHRDVKPANVIVTPDGVVKLVDFGIAKAADAGAGLTREGAPVGTVAYMSPEQARGTPADARADVWASGVVLYEMLAGARPFRGVYEQALVYSILNEAPPPLLSRAPDVPAPLAQIADRCLAKDPDARYADGAALVDALDAVRVGDAYAGTHGSRSSGGAVRWASAAALVALGVLGWWAWPASSDLAAADRGVREVAVLPFANVGGDADNQAFIDGLAYTISATLGGMEGFADRLSVLPIDDARAAGAEGPSEAARLLGVDLVVGGSVQRAADRVRLTLDVFDAAAGRLVGTRLLDKPMADVLALQDSVALVLAGLLDLELTTAEERALRAGGTTSPGAFDYYAQARGYLQDYEDAQSVESAIGLFQRAIEADADYALAWAGLGEAFWRRYELARDADWADRAAEAAEQAVELGPDLAPVRVTLGIVYKGTGRYEDAERELRRALALDASNAEAHRHLAATYYYLGRLDDAERAYRQAIALKPGYWAFYNSLGFLYDAQGRHDEALPVYRRVVELRPDNPWGYNNVGAQHHNLGRLDSAVVWYRRAATVNPSITSATAQAYKNLGEIYAQRGEAGEAVEMHERAVALDSTDAQAWAFLAEAQSENGALEAARAAWRRMIALDRQTLAVNPNDQSALAGLAVGHARTGEPDAARAALQRLEALPQLKPNVLRDMAATAELLGDREQALDYIGHGLKIGLRPVDVEESPALEAVRADPRYRTLLAQAEAPAE